MAVLGGGPDARLIAALGVAAGVEVALFSAYARELELLRRSSGVSVRGAGPIGVYQVDRDGPSVRTTSELDSVVAGAEIVFLTGPIHKQRTYAMVLADHLTDGQILVLAPGRTFGALETAWMLRIGGCRADIAVVEALGAPYWIAASGATLELSAAGPMAAGVLPRNRPDALRAVAALFPGLDPMDGVLASSFRDLSAAVEIPALILGGAGLTPGGPAVPAGAAALPENASFAALIGAEQRTVIGLLAEERRRVAAAFGVRGLPETEDWIAQFAGAAKGAGARPVPERAAAQAMLRDGVIGSLTPLVGAAELAGAPTPITRSVIALSDAILGADAAAAGRRLSGVGVDAADPEAARRLIDGLTVGAK